MAIGGQAPKAVRSVEIYDFKDDRWLALSDMPVRRCRCGVAVVRGLIYAVGGFNGSLRVRTVDAYDPVRDAWTTAPNMEKRRSTLGKPASHVFKEKKIDLASYFLTQESQS